MILKTSTASHRRRPLLGDEQLDDWQPLLSDWWDRFRDDPVTVEELRVALSLDSRVDGPSLPTSLLRPRAKGPDSLKRSLGRRLAALLGWTIGQYTICDGGHDSHHKVRAWRLQLAEAGEMRDSQEGITG